MEITKPIKGQLSVVGQELTNVPADLGEKYGSETKILDLSHNQLKKLENLEKFTLLKSLIADSNDLESEQEFPLIPSLNTLCVNDNDISDIEHFLDVINKSFPNLTYLSMLKNPACPNYFIGKDQEDYQRYRYYVLHKLKNLKFLDSTPVSEEERKEAMRVGAFMKVARPQSNQEEKEENGDYDYGKHKHKKNKP